MDVDPNLTVPLASGATPPGFRPHSLELAWNLGVPREVVWAWLNDPRTFTRGQLPPFRVEFLPMPDGRPGGFEPGCLNAHHGPLMSFHGVIGEVRAPEYRDLIYGYGSYALSMRVARPRRLGLAAPPRRPGGGTRTERPTSSRSQSEGCARRERLFWSRPAVARGDRATWLHPSRTLTASRSKRQ